MFHRPSCFRAITALTASALYLFSLQAIANTLEPIVVGSQPGDAQCLNFGDQAKSFGSITDDHWRSWMPDFRFSTGEQHLSVEITANSTNLRHRYTPSDRGSDRVVVGSHLEPHRTYRISQMVYLEPGWEWGGDTYEGGKLGFGFGGGTTPSGGIVDIAGFTARIMWRGNYLGGGKYDGTGRLSVYSYAADRPDNIGEDYFIGDYQVPVGEWFNITYEIRANSSIDEYDGHARAWINGDLLLEQYGIAWQQAGDQPVIDTLYYSSFYGGSNRGWAPSKPTYAKFKNVCWAPVISGYSGIDPDNGRFTTLSSQSANEEINLRAPDESTELKNQDWFDLRQVLLQKTEEATVHINVIAPDALPPAPQHYSESVMALNQAMDAVRDVSAKSMGINPVVSALQAIEELNSAVQLNSVTDIEIEEVLQIRQLIKETIEQYPMLASLVAEKALEGAGCNDSAMGERFCLESRALFLDASVLTESITYTTPEDLPFLGWQAEQAWNQYVDAINVLEVEILK